MMLGRVSGKRKRGCQRRRWMDTITADSRQSLEQLRVVVQDREMWGDLAHRVTKSQTQLNDCYHHRHGIDTNLSGRVAMPNARKAWLSSVPCSGGACNALPPWNMPASLCSWLRSFLMASAPAKGIHNLSQTLASGEHCGLSWKVMSH